MDPKDFEKETRELLALKGWAVTEEILTDHKKVDALASKADDFGELETIAIECKCYNNPLGQAEISNIFANYLPMLENGRANKLLVVTLSGLHPSANAYVRSNRRLQHITLQGLRNSIIDFGSYVNGLSRVFQNESASQYYVEQRPSGLSISFDELIQQYLEDDSASPIAVLGGYGMGKSTLAKYLASQQAKRQISDNTKRVPILINLDSISQDMNLEGLLGRHFTSENPVQSYNFNQFMHMVKLGRFLFILDGFDEMKRLSSFEALRHNMSELIRLCSKESKVILLGRPSAFATAEEHIELLRGIRFFGEREIKIEGWPQFNEYWVQPFSVDEMQIFIGRYYKFLAKRTSDVERRKFTEFENAIRSGKKEILDICSRPVQLKMFAEILPYLDNPLDDFSISELYDEFISLVLKRETGKKSRSAFDESSRRRFLSRLAFIMWRNVDQRSVRFHEIPTSLILSYCKQGEDPHDARRDLVVGSIIERKEADSIIFAHRSFQEFLVAEELVSLAKKLDTEFFSSGIITEEVAEFFVNSVGEKGAHSLLRFLRMHAKESEVSEASILRDDQQNLIRVMCKYYGIASPLPARKRRNRQAQTVAEEFVSVAEGVGILDSTKKKGKNDAGKRTLDEYSKKKRAPIKRDFSRKGFH